MTGYQNELPLGNAAPDRQGFPASNFHKAENDFVGNGYNLLLKTVAAWKVHSALLYFRRGAYATAATCEMKELRKRTGLDRSGIWKGLKELATAGVIHPPGKDDRGDVRTFHFCDLSKPAPAPASPTLFPEEFPISNALAGPVVSCGQRERSSRETTPLPTIRATVSQEQPHLKKNAKSQKSEETRQPPAAGRDPAPYRQLTDFWCEQKRRENPRYEFNGKREGHWFAKLWDDVGHDLLLAKNAILAYMADRTPYFEGHPSKLLYTNLEKFLTRAVNGGRHATRTLPARARGEYESDLGPLVKNA